MGRRKERTELFEAYDRLVEDNEKSNEAVRLREDQLLMLKELAMNGPDGVKVRRRERERKRREC